MLRLRSGQRPALVIFYDGVNDTFSSFQNAEAGIPQNESNRVSEFNLTKPERAPERRALAIADFARSRAIVLLARRVAALSAPRVADGPAPRTGLADTLLAQATMSAYLGNMQLVRALAREFGFEVLAYWQPTLAQKTSRTAYEESELAKMGVFHEHLLNTYRLMREHPSAAAVVNLGDAFKDVDEPLFIDWMHLGEKGNAMVAARIRNDVLSALNRYRRHYLDSAKTPVQPATARSVGAPRTR